ncbi:CapA family protein [Mucilaginibacter conchicola]|uniref:CapA family protein n=1 Tax=Mucilaginibacter conchicola TaxID=2303333 RepID=A0A372P013_9SPHI|nr:CapA family protein [Mucilaginibacter conchicola]RFZ95718.1 CapA family protein [Mucilaginibacter conchicola]
MNIRFYIYIIIVMVISACGDASHSKKAVIADEPVAEAPVKQDTIVAEPDRVINVAAVGDIMLGSSYPDSSGIPPDSARGTFKYVIKDLKNADIAFANLEGVLLDTGAPVGYKLNFKHKPYLFRMPERFGGVIKDAGFNVLSVGNNHSNDFDLAGRKSTIKVLDSLGINTAGFKSHPTKTFTKNGVRYGFCAFSPNAQTVSLLQTKAAQELIRDLKAKSDVVIVSFHGGGEGVGYEHVIDTVEIFKGENRGNLKKFTHAAIDAGADLVLGHGPHVTRAMELYKNRLIAYSLGNFATYKGVSVSGICGLAPLLKVKMNKKGEFLSGQICSYRQDHFAGVKPDTLFRASRKIKELTAADFLQPGISISDTGTIVPLVAAN